MSFDPEYEYTTKHKWRYDPKLNDYVYDHYVEKSLITKYVIIDENSNIFNYMEIVNELVAMHQGIDIKFGIGRTYKGPSITNPTLANQWKIERAKCGAISGFKRHHSGKRHLIVNKTERTACNSHLHDSHYSEMANEIFDELGIEVNPSLIKSAYNNMRHNRRYMSGDVWEDGYAQRDYRYGCYESWKNHKKTRQWNRCKNTIRQAYMNSYMECLDENILSDIKK